MNDERAQDERTAQSTVDEVVRRAAADRERKGAIHYAEVEQRMAADMLTTFQSLNTHMIEYSEKLDALAAKVDKIAAVSPVVVNNNWPMELDTRTGTIEPVVRQDEDITHLHARTERLERDVLDLQHIEQGDAGMCLKRYKKIVDMANRSCMLSDEQMVRMLRDILNGTYDE